MAQPNQEFLDFVQDLLNTYFIGNWSIRWNPDLGKFEITSVSPPSNEITVEYYDENLSSWLPFTSGGTIQISDDVGGPFPEVSVRITNSGLSDVTISNEQTTGDIDPPGEKIDVGFSGDGPVLQPGQTRFITFELKAGSNFGAGAGTYNAQATFQHDAGNVVSPFIVNFQGIVT